MGDRRTLRPIGIRAGLLLHLPRWILSEAIAATPLGEPATGKLLAPVEPPTRCGRAA